MFLSTDELRQLTGYVRPSAQFRQLIRMGYSPDCGRDGRPILARDVVLGRQCDHVFIQQHEPDFSGVKSNGGSKAED